LLASAEVFRSRRYFLSDEFSLVDATVAPILWRLGRWQIDLSGQAQEILKYGNLIFSRPAFRESLTRVEREMNS
jgi:RNA polymerase-associated protein